MAKRKLQPVIVPEEVPLKLDLGCGPNKLEGFTGVDIRPFPGVDRLSDLTKIPWVLNHAEEGGRIIPGDVPLGDESVSEVYCSHFVEHLTGPQRVEFFNELYRVLKTGAQARIICPNWSHERSYGDPTHQWPPVCSWTFFYLNKAWRDANAPHVGYTCDFDHAIVGLHDPNDQWVSLRNMETKIIMMSRNVNTTTDVIATLTKRPAV